MKKSILYWWNYFWMMTIQHPRSTWSGLFSFVGIVSLALVEKLSHPHSPLNQITFFAGVAGFAKLMLKCLSPDVNKQFIQNALGDVQTAAAHQTPNIPAQAISSEQAATLTVEGKKD